MDLVLLYTTDKLPSANTPTDLLQGHREGQQTGQWTGQRRGQWAGQGVEKAGTGRSFWSYPITLARHMEPGFPARLMVSGILGVPPTEEPA